jgi:small subunit ribosomal protein S18
VRAQGFSKRKKTDTTRKRKRRENVREQNQCRFCRSKIKYVDYKDLEVLSKLLTHRGKIFSRKRSGNCASCQRKVRLAIKRARFMGLLPFTS